uniref:Fe2OG dioxygenase domain-containing protein n=1 Tax=Helicotheca tamesis TaxID=374047 RepID=A0A7S2DUY8_9STRA|mmetsp:Transcript_10150/g.14187  ORF Transcript_10150/g.14187 Transcript_10150/m.14187 type:complete len:516 (+) Transcript_10150:32-1579(+)
MASPLQQNQRGKGTQHLMLFLFKFSFLASCCVATSGESLTCSANHDHDGFEKDPALKEMTFDIGYGEETFEAYVQPDVSSFYHEEVGSIKEVKPHFVALAGKFVNMSPHPLRLYWDPDNGGTSAIIAYSNPFEATGTATFPFHKFYFTTMEDNSEILARFTVTPPQSIYYYDPIEVPDDPVQTQRNLDALSKDELSKYEVLKRTKLFAEKYFEFTGRQYLANYPRKQPSHFMWRADYFGQQHWATTKETHFVELPSVEELQPIVSSPKERVLKEDQPRILQQYRTKDQNILNMTLKVLSCAPRAFEIPNFLSTIEVNHILKLSTGMDLSLSTTSGSDKMLEDEADTSGTRTSFNTWVYRQKSPIVDAIYRRAADLLQIDEALLRHRDNDEYPELRSKTSISEALQLVHYEDGQEYTAHHDFGYPKVDENQSARYLTLLLYLNEGMKGGETSFPRWVNGKTGKGLHVVPEVGKAVLFYSQLPDGNMDDLSQHAALPVTDGEKWLMNLWIWDPIYGK